MNRSKPVLKHNCDWCEIRLASIRPTDHFYLMKRTADLSNLGIRGWNVESATAPSTIAAMTVEIGALDPRSCASFFFPLRYGRHRTK